MKRFLAISISALFPIFLFCNNETDSTLKRLDKAIENSRTYTNNKELKIEELRALQKTISSDQQYYDHCHQLHNAYQSYKYDSAYAYAGRMLQFAEKLKNPNLIAESKIALAFSCMSAGLFKEATEIANSINTQQLQSDYRANLYEFLSILNINMAGFSSTEPYSKTYAAQSLNYSKRSITLLKVGSAEYRMAQIRTYQLENRIDKAIRSAEELLKIKQNDLHNFAIASSTLGYFYLTKADTVKAIRYFASAAITDLKMATKETTAIRQLAEILYTKGDIQRAYAYATLALEDANFYNARQRKIEVGRILPIIEAGRFAIIKEQKDRLLIYSGIISILFILFVMATIIILKQKKRLNAARIMILEQNTNLLTSNEQLTEIQRKISKKNTDLIGANEKLKETHRIKDEYIGYFFSTNSTYLEKMEEYRKLVARKIRNHQYDELAQLGNLSDSRKEREKLFALFDQIFIKLFPDFVDRYNQLFKKEDQIQIKSDGILPPEIRIFALIRLGISESERIAHFLDFSLSTVKNYKTKAKNRSVTPNELFESKIMEIESVKVETEPKTNE